MAKQQAISIKIRQLVVNFFIVDYFSLLRNDFWDSVASVGANEFCILGSLSEEHTIPGMRTHLCWF
jgi:hypothetical protein